MVKQVPYLSSYRKIKHKLNDLNLNRILRLVYQVEPKLTLLTVGLLLLESVLWMAALYTSKEIIDLVGKSQSGKEVIIRALLPAAGIAILYTLVKSLSAYITEIQAAKINEHIDDRIHERSMNLDLPFYESPAYFDTLKRAREAGPDKPAAIITDLVELLKNTVMLCTITALLFKINWVLLPLLLLFAIPTVLVKMNVARKLHQLRLSQTATERKASYFSYLISSDTTAKEIRVFGLGQYFRTRYGHLRQALLQQRMSVRRKNVLAELGASLFAITGVFSCIAAIALSAFSQKNSVGDLTIFMVVFLQAFGVVQAITNGISRVYQNNIIVKSIFELLDIQNEDPGAADRPSAARLDKALLSVRDLSFNYPGSNKSGLQNIDLELQKGQIIALVGANGSGKSTLIKLLCRLYQPDSGAIYSEGRNLHTIGKEEFRALVSPVFQDFVRYNVSIADNIGFGDIDRKSDMPRIIHAAEAAGVHVFAETLPGVYDTLMGKIFEEGHEISIGQWQKLAIARALYSKAQILILDEATSALDAHAEEELFAHFKQHIGDRAAIIISHRLSTIQQADLIYVLSEGQIQASGKHEELLITSEDYRMLFSKTPLAV